MTINIILSSYKPESKSCHLQFAQHLQSRVRWSQIKACLTYIELTMADRFCECVEPMTNRVGMHVPAIPHEESPCYMDQDVDRTLLILTYM